MTEEEIKGIIRGAISQHDTNCNRCCPGDNIHACIQCQEDFTNELYTKLYPPKIKECLLCPHHRCYMAREGLDCSCDLSVFVTPCSTGIPKNCPLYSPMPEGLGKDIAKLFPHCSKAESCYYKGTCADCPDTLRIVGSILSLLREAGWKSPEEWAVLKFESDSRLEVIELLEERVALKNKEV